MIRLATKTNAPMDTMPTICVTRSPEPKIPTANVPQIPAHQMSRDGPHNVVYLELVEPGHGQHNQNTPDGTYENCQQVILQIRTRRNGDEPTNGAVQAPGQVNLLVEYLGQDHGCDDACGGGEVGIDINNGHGRDIKGRSQCQLGTTIETEPAKPEDERSQRCQRQIGARHGIDATVRSEFSASCSEHDCACQCGPAAG